jgi:hypothetical protein
MRLPVVQFPVDFWLYLQFRKKKWSASLAEMAAQLRTEPTLNGYYRYLVSLLTYGIRQRIFRTKTQLAADLVRQAVACVGSDRL